MNVALVRGRRSRAIHAAVFAGTMWACGSKRTMPQAAEPAPSAPRILPLARVIALETSGPTPSDTSVSFTAGTPQSIVLRQGPPENVPFARLEFPAGAF